MVGNWSSYSCCDVATACETEFAKISSTVNYFISSCNAASAQFIAIQKHNLLSYYSQACEKAFTKSTIKSVFQKTGIWPFNHDAIEDVAFAPALNTTTQAAQPVPATVPDFIIAVAPSIMSTTEAPSATSNNTPAASAMSSGLASATANPGTGDV